MREKGDGTIIRKSGRHDHFENIFYFEISMKKLVFHQSPSTRGSVEVEWTNKEKLGNKIAQLIQDYN